MLGGLSLGTKQGRSTAGKCKGKEKYSILLADSMLFKAARMLLRKKLFFFKTINNRLQENLAFIQKVHFILHPGWQPGPNVEFFFFHPAEESAPPKEMRIVSGCISGWTMMHIYWEMVTGLQRLLPVPLSKMIPVFNFRPWKTPHVKQYSKSPPHSWCTSIFFFLFFLNDIKCSHSHIYMG